MAVPLAVIEREPPVPPPAISSIAVALQQPDALERHAEPFGSTCANGAAWPWP